MMERELFELQVSGMGRKRFCFVIPRFFEGIAGGAETLVGSLAMRLHERGDYVELLATCARDNRTWHNEFPAGESSIAGMRLLRFPVDDRNLEAWVPVQRAIHEGKTVSCLDQMTWMQESVNSVALYRYLAQEGGGFDHIFFGPYLFGTTFWGSQIYPAKSVLIPCLHDESYAYLDLIAAMFRNVSGCLFNAAPEMELARSLYGGVGGGVVGMGFDLPTADTVSALEPYFGESFPYILYLGRKETGKNAHTLIDYFCEIKDRGLIEPSMKLVILGGGSFSDLHREDAVLRNDVVDLPHVGEREKQRLLRHALYLCQPSTNESFSIVLMEAWMVGTPVVVHGECAVTKHHVVESGGGLYMSSPSDLAGVTQFFARDPNRRSEFAARGRDYVGSEFSWEAVLSRFDAVVARLQQHEGTHTACADLMRS
jgi:glycosyltransferase involved in cell wall biosynthesis